MKYSSAEVNYAYRSAYLTFCNQYGSYLSYVGLDTSKALDEQECRISDDFDTWDDYFKDAAEKNLVQVTALCDAAQKAGVTLDEDDQHEIDEQFPTSSSLPSSISTTPSASICRRPMATA